MTLAEEFYPEVDSILGIDVEIPARLRASLVRSRLSGSEVHSPAVPRLAAGLLQL